MKQSLDISYLKKIKSTARRSTLIPRGIKSIADGANSKKPTQSVIESFNRTKTVQFKVIKEAKGK